MEIERVPCPTCGGEMGFKHYLFPDCVGVLKARAERAEALVAEQGPRRSWGFPAWLVALLVIAMFCLGMVAGATRP
jgi:hypothetical protein